MLKITANITGYGTIEGEHETAFHNLTEEQRQEHFKRAGKEIELILKREIDFSGLSVSFHVETE